MERLLLSYRALHACSDSSKGAFSCQTVRRRHMTEEACKLETCIHSRGTRAGGEVPLMVFDPRAAMVRLAIVCSSTNSHDSLRAKGIVCSTCQARRPVMHSSATRFP